MEKCWNTCQCTLLILAQDFCCNRAINFHYKAMKAGFTFVSVTLPLRSQNLYSGLSLPTDSYNMLETEFIYESVPLSPIEYTVV